MTKYLKNSLMALIVAVALGAPLKAQIAVAPPVLFIDGQSRSNEMIVVNQSSAPKEIAISLKFGYFGTDSLGKIDLVYNDSVAEKQYSIVNNISFFPKKFVLQPGEQQSVKFLAKNLTALADGEYWTRIVTASSDIKKQIDSTNIGDSVRVGLSLKFNFISALFVQKGKLNNNVEVGYKNMFTDSVNVNLLFNMNRSGNAPFLGTADIIIYDANEDEVEKINERIPVYFNSIRRFSINKAKLKPGTYTGTLTLSNEQPDVPDNFKIPFEKIVKKFNFTVSNN